MSEDEDDDVIDEIPVFLSHDLEDQLIVFQYPVIPASADTGIGQVLKSQIKPENQQVRLEVALDTSSVNYDRTHGEQIAISLEKENASEGRMYSQKVMDKMVISSSRCLTDKDSYCIGVMRDHELHLTPIRGALSLRPDLTHLEPSNNDKTGEDELEQVRVQFARTESDRVKQLREQSYSTYVKKVSQEKWFNTEYHDANSPLSKGTRGRLGSSSRGDVDLTLEGYLDSVTPQEEKSSTVVPALPDSVLSLNSLRKLVYPSDKVKMLLKEVKTVSLSQLVWVCEEEEEEVLRCVQEAAVLVQGNWVLRSDILFPKDTYSPHNGVPADAMLRARDYILYNLNACRVLERKKLSSVIKLPCEELKDIMSQVAVLKQNKLWYFRLPTDEQFIRRYPEIVEREERLWKARYERLKEGLEEGGKGVMCLDPSVSPRKKEQRRRKDSVVSSSGDEEAANKQLARRKKKMLTDSVTKLSGVVKMEPLDNTPPVINIKREFDETPATAHSS